MSGCPIMLTETWTSKPAVTIWRTAILQPFSTHRHQCPSPSLFYCYLCWWNGGRTRSQGKSRGGNDHNVKVFCILITAAYNILISINVDRNQDIVGGGDHLTDSNLAALLHPQTSMCPGVASRPHLLWSVLMRERYPTRGVHGKEKLSSFTVKSSSRTPISSVLPPPPSIWRGGDKGFLHSYHRPLSRSSFLLMLTESWTSKVAVTIWQTAILQPFSTHRHQCPSPSLFF